MFFLCLIVLTFNVFALDQLDIQFTPKNQKIINFKKKYFLKTKKIYHKHKKAKAFLYLNEEAIKVEVSTTGELPKHWARREKSYDIKLLKGKTYKGLKQFKLIKGSDKHFFVESFAYDLAKELNLITPRYDFVELCSNKSECGLYFFREKETKDFFERRLLRGSVFYKPRIGLNKYLNKEETIYESQYRNGFQNYNKAKDLVYFYKGIGSKVSYSGFTDFLKTGKHLDKNKYLKWFLIQWHFGSFHASEMDNRSWIFNDESLKYEPYLYDVLLGSIQSSKKSSIEHFIKNDRFLLKSIDVQEIKKISKTIRDKMMTFDVEKWISKYKGHMSQSDLKFLYILRDKWNRNLKIIKSSK